MNLLHLDSSVFGAHSVSRLLSAEIVQAWRAADPALAVTYRDLAETVPPQLTGELAAALKLGTQPASVQGRADLARIGEMLEEFLAADAVVIGAPMYNFSVPTQLKTWLDAIAQAGRTFEYTPQGPRGLAGGKRVVIASARGNIYSTADMAHKDFQERYLAEALRFLGIGQVEIVRAEGVNRGPAVREAALADARQAIARLFAPAQEAQPA